MKFSGFYTLAGFMAGVGAMKASGSDPVWSILFLGAAILCLLGAIFEACNAKE